MIPSELPDDAFWQQVHRQRPIEAIRRCDEAAKQLISLTALLSTVYFSLLSFSSVADRLANMVWWVRLVLVAPLVFWLVSLILAIFVIIPREVRTGVEKLAEVYSQASQNKYFLVRISYFSLIFSIVAVAILAVLFLFQPDIFIHLSPNPRSAP